MPMERTYRQHARAVKRPRRDFVHLAVKLDRLKVELSGADAYRCLQEINRMLDKLNRATGHSHDHPHSFDYHLEAVLSDELMRDRNVTKLLDKLAQLYHDYRTERVVLENKKIVELEKGMVHTKIDAAALQRGVRKFLFHIPKEQVRHAVVHVKGDIAEEDARMILDQIERELPNAELHPAVSRGDVPTHTLIEGVFFGEFPYDTGDDAD